MYDEELKKFTDCFCNNCKDNFTYTSINTNECLEMCNEVMSKIQNLGPQGLDLAQSVRKLDSKQAYETGYDAGYRNGLS